MGLLGRVERKNGWQLAEAMGETDPQGVQRLLNSARWDPEAVRDDLGNYVVEHLGDEDSGVLVVDETGFLKKGKKSVGVARQYTRTAGETVNCQVGVFLAYASERGAGFVDRSLYLPREWTNDPSRRAEAGVPEEVTFANKIELAKRMLQGAFAAGIPARWVAADSFYGRSHQFSANGWRSTVAPTWWGSQRRTPSESGDAGRRSSGSPNAYPKERGLRFFRRQMPAIDAPGSGLAWSYPPIRPRTCVDGYCSAVTPKTRMTSVSTKPTAPRGRPSRN